MILVVDDDKNIRLSLWFIMIRKNITFGKD